MIADPFEISDAVQDHRQGMAGLEIQLRRVDLDQITADLIFIAVDPVLQPDHFLFALDRVIHEHIQRLVNAFHGVFRHIAGCSPGLFQRKGRIGEETVVQRLQSPLRFLFLSLLIIDRDRPERQLYEETGERQRKKRGCQIDQCVDPGHGDHAGLIFQKSEMQERIQGIKNDHKGECLDDIEIKMHQSGPLAVLIGPERRKDRRDTGAHLGADDDRDRHSHGDEHGSRQRHQDTDGGCGGLDHHGKKDPDQKTDHRIGK